MDFIIAVELNPLPHSNPQGNENLFEITKLTLLFTFKGITKLYLKLDAIWDLQKPKITAYSSNPYWLLKHAEIIQFHGSQPIK